MTPRQLPLFANQPQSVSDLNPQSELRYTFALFQQYLVGEGKSQHTVNAFTSDLQLLSDQAGGETALGDLTTTDLNEFLEWLEHGRGVPCSRKSYARRVTTLKVFFKWLHSVGAIPYDPAKPILQRSGPAPLATALTPDEVMAALYAARQLRRGEETDTRPEMLFKLILDTGIKKSEAMGLHPRDIDRSNPRLPVLTVKHKVRNVFKERIIELDTDWLPLLDAYLVQYHPQDTLFNCTARNLEYVLSDVGEGAALAVKVSFEMLRWTCAVRDMRAGQEEDFIRDKMGLSPISWVETRSKIKKLIELQMTAENPSFIPPEPTAP